MQVNKNDQNDAEALAQIVRMGWYRPVRAVGASSKPEQGKPRRASLRRKAVQKLSASDG